MTTNILTVCVFIGIILMAVEVRSVNIPKQLEGFKNQFLPAEYRNTNFTVDDLRKIFHAKCKKVNDSSENNSELYEQIEHSAMELGTCFSNLFNLTAMEAEITAALPIGELDTVFHDYCDKAPQMKQCFLDFNEIIQKCLTLSEQKQNRIMVHLASGLLDFMCTRGGDHLALFVAEEGPECIEENKERIAQCANESFNDLLASQNSGPLNLADLYTLPELILQPEHCKNLQEFEACTVHHLEQCREITPANLAESIFRYIKNGTSCRNWKDNELHSRTKWRQSNQATNYNTISVLVHIFVSILISTFLTI